MGGEMRQKSTNTLTMATTRVSFTFTTLASKPLVLLAHETVMASLHPYLDPNMRRSVTVSAMGILVMSTQMSSVMNVQQNSLLSRGQRWGI